MPDPSAKAGPEIGDRYPPLEYLANGLKMLGDHAVKSNRNPAHIGNLRNAIDFIVDKETPVLAAENGIITFVKDSSNIGGSDPMYWRHTNFIVIMHSNGEYSRYDHLSYGSSKVKVGQHVRAGEEIAKVGMTEYTYLPHLHFQVFVVTGINVWTDFDTVEVQDQAQKH
jgi:murein DD-endopeptidase MepM/ murein hydrolase activator NlpD